MNYPYLCENCNQPYTEFTDCSTMQIAEASMARAVATGKNVPIGTQMGNIRRLADEELVETVRVLIHHVEAQRLQLEELREALQDHLTVRQFELVFTELVAYLDMHDVLQQIDRARFATRVETQTFNRQIQKFLHDPDNRAIAARASVNATSVVALSAFFRGIKSLYTLIGADAACGLLVFSCFVLYEYRKYANGDTKQWSEFCNNIGEHAVGTFGGSAGALAGTLLGSLLPGGTIVGAILGEMIGSLLGDATSRYFYRHYVPTIVSEDEQVEEDVIVNLTELEIAKKAATKLGISLKHHSFEEAKTRWRKLLLREHPDKLPPDAAPELILQKTLNMQELLAAWSTVRHYYRELHPIEEVRTEALHSNEGFFQFNVLRVREKIDAAWKYAGTCWFGAEIEFGRAVDPS